MRRREFVALLGGAAVAMPRLALARQGKRIGYLSYDAAPPLEAQQSEPIWRNLRELGYVEGANLAIERRYAGQREERLSAMAAELVALEPDLIFAVGGEAADAARFKTGTIPIVVVGVGDPVGTGLVFSLARPSGNVTGVTEASPELSVKRLELLKEAVPTAARVASVYNPSNRGDTITWRLVRAAAKTLNIALVSFAISEFAEVERERPDAMLITTDALALLDEKRVIDFAERTRLPVIYELSEPVYHGGLMSYGPSMPDIAARCAYFVDRILKGAQPGDLPMEEPTRFHFVLNSKAARALGLTIPPSVIARVDELIE